MKTHICRLLSIVTLAATGVFHCSLNELAGGGGSDVGNGRVLGAIVTSNGNPAANTQVLLIPHEYNLETNGPLADTLIDTTDASGAYNIKVPKGGVYNILAAQFVTRMRLIITNINVIRNDTVYVPVDTLREVGSMKVMLPDSVDAVNGYVFFPGTTIAKLLSGSSSFVVLDSVPAGIIPAVFYSTTTGTVSAAIRYAVRVSPGDTAVIFNPDWKYARQLVLNTSAAGAGVQGDVYDFPVLVRLTAATFTFAQAKSGGADLRLTKEDNTFLPYEIERWDSAGSVAEIWVKVDTVFGNDHTQFITLYWGNPATASESSGSAVFDTAEGFQGIWHLGENDSLSSDATGNGYNGTGYFTACVPGMIGNAQHFNGASSCIRMKGTAPQSRLNFPMSGRYTVSAWVYHDTLADSVTYVIAGKGEHQYFMKAFGLAQSTPTHAHQWEFTEYHGNDIWHAVTCVPAAEKRWTYLVGIRDGSNQFLYVNGALAMQGYQVFGIGQDTIPRDTSDDFSIGAFLRPVTAWNQGYAYFSGAIDETGVSSVPRSADWVKLCYMNQKEQDALVKW